MKKILVIENERMVFLDIKKTFEKSGYEVVFGNIQNIVSLFSSAEVPELIILDVWTMVHMNGLLKFSLSTYSKFKGVPVILTSSSQKGTFRFCMTNKITVIGELYKPYASSELVEMYLQYKNDSAFENEFVQFVLSSH